MKRSEVNNRSCNAEPAAVRQLITDLELKNIRILSVTSDNGSSLNRLFRAEFPHIHHYLDLWHILRNMYRKFAPKFNNVCYFCFIFYIYIYIYQI